MKKIIYSLFASAMIYSPVSDLEDDSKVPVLLYHSWTGAAPCNYGSSDLVALEQDIQTLQQNGWAVMPLKEVVRWQLGWCTSSSMPDKVVALTFDDGHAADVDYNYDPCGQQRSVRSILINAGVHGSTFVIASPAARSLIDTSGHMSHLWWDTVNNESLMTVYNHSLDHDHNSITYPPPYDPAVGNIRLPAGGAADSVWKGLNDPLRFTNWASSNRYVRIAGEFIESKIGEYPEIFAHPFGYASTYMKSTYFPSYPGQHRTIAAFCTEVAGNGPAPDNYVTRDSDRYCLPRFTKGASWNTPQELMDILDGV